MGRRWRRDQLGWLGIVLLAAVLVPAIAVAAGGHASAVPAQLVGRWTRTVSKADVQRTGGTGVPAGTKCTLSIAKNGKAHVACTTIGAFDGTIVPAGSHRVHINVGAAGANSYSWAASRGRLTLTHGKDDVWDRKAVFEGTWKRK